MKHTTTIVAFGVLAAGLAVLAAAGVAGGAALFATEIDPVLWEMVAWGSIGVTTIATALAAVATACLVCCGKAPTRESGR